MNEIAKTHGSRSHARVLFWGVGLAWIVVYLLLMAHGGWAWEGAGLGPLGFGVPKTTSLERFGAPVPRFVEGGDWPRVFLSPWLHRSLLGLLLLVWFWSSVGRRLSTLFGPARGWLLFVAGGAGGAAAQVLTFPDSSWVGGAGPFDGILGGLGALLLWGVCNPGPVAKAVVRSTVITLLFIAALSWYFTRDLPDTEAARALIGVEAEIGAFAAGALAMLLLGPRRSNRPAGGWTRAASFGALALVGVAVAIQAPKALASAERSAAGSFLARLEQTEYETWKIARDPVRATASDRQALDGRLDAVLAHDFMDGHDGLDALRAYVDALRAYTSPDVPAPWVTEGQCRKTFRAWFEAFEQPMRHAMGLPARARVRHYWEPR